VAHQNARALAKRHEVEVLTLDRGGSADASRAPYRLHVAGPPSKLWALRFARALRRLPLEAYDAIVLNDLGAAYAAGASLPARALHKSCVYTHGSEPQVVLCSPSWGYRLTGIRRWYRRALRHCRRVVAVSRYQRERYLRAAAMPGLGAKASVAYAGIDRALFRPKPAPALRARMAPAGENVLLSVSRVEASKGLPAMYRVFRTLVREEEGRWRWVVVGDGGYLDTLEAQAARDGLGHCIWFAGHQPRHRLPAFYTEADVFWLLSERESFGLVFLEANACGTPVLARAHSGMMEAVEDGASGLLVADEAACLDALRARAVQALRPGAAKTHAARFDLDATTAVLAELLLDSSRSTAPRPEGRSAPRVSGAKST
jgi:glycosyltransferase involved in cell wall biosynthesis